MSNKTDCFAFVNDVTTARARLQLVLASAAYLNSYRKRFHQLEQCGNQERQMTEQAYEAERHLRVILKFGIDSLNEIVDSGKIEKVLEELKHRAQDSTNELMDKAFNEADQFLQQFQNWDSGLLDESRQLIRSLYLQTEPLAEGLGIRFRSHDGQEQRHTILSKAQPGDTGRIGSREFFSSDKLIISTEAAAMQPQNDCHRRVQEYGGQQDDRLDLYGNILSGFALARDTMYMHAREVDELGVAQLRGQDPGTLGTLIVVGVVVAAAMIVAGATIEIGCLAKAWSGSICDFGLVLIGGGILLGGILVCVTSTNCAFVIQGYEVATLA